MGFLDYILRPDFILFLISLLIFLTLYLYPKYEMYQQKRAAAKVRKRFARYTPGRPIDCVKAERDSSSSSSSLGRRDTASSPVSIQRESSSARVHIDYDVNLAPVRAAAKPSKFDKHFIVRATLSGIVLAAALFIIIKGTHPQASMEWAYGAIGLIIGYWLK